MSNGLTRRELEITDIEKIRHILDTSLVTHVGMVDGDEPYVVPMNFGYIMDGDKLTIYLHGAKKGRKIDVLRANPKVFFEMECDLQPFEGDVACRYGMAYSSLMGKGNAVIVEDVEEKKLALSAVMKTQTGRDFTFEDKMVSFVNIIRIDVTAYTAKCRPIPKK
ncbi:MAG: pyridoxamine 5'-phosphate oxidase family protein [Clostridia bacterium]|nr:pyridoxamine 5'-phosphate oxidase family protein [Clostridia bacterium]